MGECTIKDVTAICDHQPPGPQTLRVSATAVCPTEGWEVTLSKSEPQGINPKELLLDVNETAPAGDVAQIVTEIPVEFVDDSETEYDSVSIKDGPASTEVQHVH